MLIPIQKPVTLGNWMGTQTVVSESFLNEDLETLPAIPPTWTHIKIGDICHTTSGGTPARKYQKYYEGDIPWIKSGELNFNIIRESEEHISEEGLYNSSSKIIPKNTLLVALYGATVGKLALLGIDAAINQAVCAIFTPSQLNKKFCYYFLFYNRPQLLQSRKGGAQPNISQLILNNIELPFPPLPEQHRIVTKIEELLTQLDAGVASLKKAQAQLKRYRQAVLKAAFEGRLTQVWREEHKGGIEPAEVLIEQIRKTPEFVKHSITDRTSLPNQPNGWTWVKLGQLTDMSAGKAFLKSEYSEKGVKLLQIANVSFGKIIWDVVTYLPQEYLVKYPELNLKTGDMLIALNRPVLDGKLKIGTLKERDAPSILYQRVGRFDLYNQDFRDFIFYFAQSPSFINYFNKSLQGIEIPFINKPVLLNALVALPPLKEQKIIVSEIERLFSIADEVEQTITTSLHQSDSLRQSILKRAFEGKLVPQDLNDEPASVLLERIKAEKAHHTAETKKGKTLQPKSPKRKIKNAN